MRVRRGGLLDRIVRALRRRRRPLSDLPDEAPPDSFVREPRRPRPSSSGGVIALEPPETDAR